MKTKILLLTLGFGLWTLDCFSATTNYFVYYGTDQNGSPLTNQITIDSTGTNGIVAVGTNIVAGFSRTYTPDANGKVSGYLATGNYRLSIDGAMRSVNFGIVTSTSTQNLAQVAGIPVPQFMNFTIAQFSDAGTAARSNANQFATNSYAGISAGLGFYPATNSPYFTTTNNPTNSYTVNQLYTNPFPRSWLAGWASGTVLDFTNTLGAFQLPVTNDFCVPLSSNATFKFQNFGRLTNVVNWTTQ